MAYEYAENLDNLWVGEKKGLKIRGVRVLLVRLDDRVLAYENKCAHLSVALDDGDLTDGVLTCRAHGWQYDIHTGAGRNPTGVCLRSFPVRIQGSEIWIELKEEEGVA